MSEDRVAGTVRNVGGKAQEGLGRVTGDIKTQTEGVANQVAGAAQDIYGQARESGAKLADALSDSVRDTIEHKPYTAVAIALAIGWILGRTRRPL